MSRFKQFAVKHPVAFGLVIVNVQAADGPEQDPSQLLKMESSSAVAVSVTTLPSSSTTLQASPQSILGGSLIIVPIPFPDLLTVSR